MSDEDNRDRLKDIERLLPWITAVLSFLAAIGGLLSAWYARDQTEVAVREAALENRVALVRYCDIGSRADIRFGIDDLFYLYGTSGDFDYAALADRHDYADALPKSVTTVLRCQFTNYSRVPILRISFFFQAGFHRDRMVKSEHNDFPFPALKPDQTRTVWFVNTDREPVIVRDPYLARYVRFPILTKTEDEPLESVAHDSWTIMRDHNPVPHLGEAKP